MRDAPISLERPRCELVVRNPMLVVQLVLVGTFGIFVALTARPLLVLVFFGSAALLTAVAYFFSKVRVIVTSQRLVIGALVVPLDSIECVELHRMMTRGPRPYRVVMRLHDGRELEARLPWVPKALVAALKSEGVSTRSHLWPWS